MGSHPTGSGQADAGPADAGPEDAGPACASQRAIDRADPYQNDASTDLLLVLAERVTALRFTTVAAYPTQDPNVNLTVTDPSAARDACRMTVTLPVMPPGTDHCPPDRGVRYVMECFDTDPAGDACPIIVATINPGWCQTATITDGTTTLARWTATAPGYWDMLAADLGVPVSALFR